MVSKQIFVIFCVSVAVNSVSGGLLGNLLGAGDPDDASGSGSGGGNVLSNFADNLAITAGRVVGNVKSLADGMLDGGALNELADGVGDIAQVGIVDARRAIADIGSGVAKGFQAITHDAKEILNGDADMNIGTLADDATELLGLALSEASKILGDVEYGASDAIDQLENHVSKIVDDLTGDDDDNNDQQ